MKTLSRSLWACLQALHAHESLQQKWSTDSVTFGKLSWTYYDRKWIAAKEDASQQTNKNETRRLFDNKTPKRQNPWKRKA